MCAFCGKPIIEPAVACMRDALDVATETCVRVRTYVLDIHESGGSPKQPDKSLIINNYILRSGWNINKSVDTVQGPPLLAKSFLGVGGLTSASSAR
jgi:hypothetical protein